MHFKNGSNQISVKPKQVPQAKSFVEEGKEQVMQGKPISKKSAKLFLNHGEIIILISLKDRFVLNSNVFKKISPLKLKKISTCLNVDVI